MAATGAPLDPSRCRDEVEDMEEQWELITALLGGTPAMRKAEKEYLPQFPAEKDVFYRDRLERSTLFNGFRRTVETMSGKPFSEALKFSDDMPAEVKAWCDDIDLEGRDLQTFLHEVFSFALGYGLSHILVDHQPGKKGLSKAQQKASGVRPYFAHIKATQVKGWRSERINGVETLTQLRICETAVEPDGRWDVKAVEQIRILYPNAWEIWRKNAKGNWTLFDKGTVSLNAIPLVTVYTGRTGFMTATPPLMDLAYLNVEHWQKSSDLSNILHVASVPLLFGSGFASDDDIVAGVQKLLTNESADADLKYVEHQGHAIGSGMEALRDIEERMRVLGANLLVRNNVSNRTTATEKSIDSAEADSALSLAALSLENAAKQAFALMAKWAKLPAGGSVTVYRDFDEVSNDTAKGDLLMKGRQEGCWSAQTVFEEAKKIGVIGEERDWTSEVKRIKEEGPLRALIGNFEVPPGSPGAPAPTAPPVAA